MRPGALLGLAFLALLPADAGSQDKEPAEGSRPEILRWVNTERERHSVPRLAPEAALNRAAQALAEQASAAGSTAEAQEPGQDVSGQELQAGYEQELVFEVLTRGKGPVVQLLDSWRDTESIALAEAMRADYRDLGMGLAGSGEDLVCVLVFGLSARDAFAQRTALLSDLKRIRVELIKRINLERKTRRLPPLRENALLDRAAQGHAQDMIRRSYYGHESPEGDTALDRARRSGYDAETVGENIAEGQSGVTEVMDAWMASPVHREHILSLEAQQIGCGVAFGKNARGYEIVWVQDFGTPQARQPLLRRRF
ncbi:MAG: CAP domain-containing protein [Thermoanaerobaculia bacterium]